MRQRQRYLLSFPHKGFYNIVPVDKYFKLHPLQEVERLAFTAQQCAGRPSPSTSISQNIVVHLVYILYVFFANLFVLMVYIVYLISFFFLETIPIFITVYFYSKYSYSRLYCLFNGNLRTKHTEGLRARARIRARLPFPVDLAITAQSLNEIRYLR